MEEAADQGDTWACEACTFHNRDGTSSCEMCGTPNPSMSAGGGGATGGSEDSSSSAYWSCQACTMQNPSVTFTCHVCGTVDESQRAKAKEAGDGAAEDGVTPELLARLSRDRHFSLQNYLTKLCHTLALAAAEAETGLSRPSIDRAFIPVLLELMSDPGSRRGPDVPLQACRALNYFLQIGAAGDVAVQQGMRTYALCITSAATAGTAEYQELGQEAVSGVDLLCRTSAEFLRELAETDIGGGGGKVLASFVRGVYRTSAGSRRGSISVSPVGHSPGGGAASAGLSADDRRSSRRGAGAGAGAEAAVAKALSLLPLLLELHPRPAGAPPPIKQQRHQEGAGDVAAAAAASGLEGKEAGGGGGESGADEAGSGSGDDKLEAILGALLAVIRGASASNREAALATLGSKVLPRLGGAAAGGREWLGELITDEDLLVAAIEDRSSRGAACHQRALGLTYQLLASSPELMSLALKPGCPLLPAVLDALGDGGGGGVGGDDAGSRVGGSVTAGLDGSGSSHHHRRITSGFPKGSDGGGGVAPGTPRSAPRTPRLTGMSGDGRRASRGGGAAADSEAAGRSGLAVLRIVGLVAAAFVDGRLPKPSSLLLGSSGGSRGGGYTPGPAIMVQVQPETATAARTGGSATGGLDGGSGGGDGRGGEQGAGGNGEHASALVSSTLARVGRGGSGAKEHQERRAKLLADLGDGTVLVSWANTGAEEIIASRRILLSSSNSLTSRARRSLARNSLFRTMMSLGGDPGSGDSDSNGDGGGTGIDDDPLASFSLSALGALGALSGGGRGVAGGRAGARVDRSILNDFLGQFIQSGNATTLRHVLAGGADPNRLVRPGQSSLMAAAAHEGGAASALEMTRILLDAGADAGFVGPEGSALHAAAAAGRSEVVSALIDAGADLDATDGDGCTPLEVCTDEPVMLMLSQALEDADEAEAKLENGARAAGAAAAGDDDSPAKAKGAAAALGATAARNSSAALEEKGNGAGKPAAITADAASVPSSSSSSPSSSPSPVTPSASTRTSVSTNATEMEAAESSSLPEGTAVAGSPGVAGSPSSATETVGAAGGSREEAMALELPDDHGHMVCVLLQTLSQSFMANPAAVHGLSAALAPPASASNGAPASTRSVAGGAAAAGLGPARDNASQHTVAVSLGKAWLELLVKLLRRASEGGVAVAGSGVVSSGTGEPNLVAAALEDPATRDALLILFERTAAGVAAAAAAVAASASAALAVKAVGTSDASPAAATSFAGLGSASSAEGRKALAWADPALVLRSLVLLREVLVHVPDAYVVPLRRRGVLHSIRTVVEASVAPSLLPGSSQPSPSSLSAAIAAATKEIVGLCDTHQSLRASRSLDLVGEGGGVAGAGTGAGDVDRLAATASSLREAVGVLRRHTTAENGYGGEVEVAEDTAMAGRRAMAAVKELAGLLSSEDGITAFEALESGVLHPLRELLTWLEGAGAATAGAARAPRLTVVAKVAAELERDAAGALALVPPSSSSSGSNGNGGEEGKTVGANRAAGSVAVLELIRLIHDVIGVEVLQVEGPDSRHALPGSIGGGGGSGSGLFGSARGIFSSSSNHTSGGDVGGGAGLEALSMPMMLQLRPSKAGLCNVRSKGGSGGGGGGGGEDGTDAPPSSLSSLTRAAGGGGRGGGGGSGGERDGAGAGAGGAGESLAILASVQPLAKLSQLREFVLRSVHITHPSYLEYCRGLLGAMVCIKPPQGAQVGAGGGGPMEQGLSNGIPMGRGRAPWEGQEQGRGMGHGRLFRVVGWDGQTGTHLLLSLPGVEEDTPWEQYLQVVLAEMSYRILLPEKTGVGTDVTSAVAVDAAAAASSESAKPHPASDFATAAAAGAAATAASTCPTSVADFSAESDSKQTTAAPCDGVWGGVEREAGTAPAPHTSVVKPSPLLMSLGGGGGGRGGGGGGGASFPFHQQQDSEGDDMELDEFALGDSALGAAAGEDGGGGGGGAKGLKAAASTAASNLRRNVRSMLTAQQQQRQQQDSRSAWAPTGSSSGSSGSGGGGGSSNSPAATAAAAARLWPLCATASPSPASGGPTPPTLGGGGSIGDLASAAPSTDSPAFSLPNASRAASAAAATAAAAGGGCTGASSVGVPGRNWVSQFRAAAGAGEGSVAASIAGGGGSRATRGAWTKCPPSLVPALGEFPPLTGVAAAQPAVVSGAGSRGVVAAAAAGRAGGTVGCGGAAAAAAAAGGSTSARFTAPSTPLPGTAPPAPDLLKEGDSVEAQFLLADQGVWTTSWYRGEVSTVNPAGGKGGAGVTYGVAFADGDRLDTVPDPHIRLFRGLRVGSVVSVEWPSKGGQPFKGCLTKVCRGDGDSSPTVSVIFEDADTEDNVPLERLRLGEDEFMAPPSPPTVAATTTTTTAASTSSASASSTSPRAAFSAAAAPSTPGSVATSLSIQASLSPASTCASTTATPASPFLVSPAPSAASVSPSRGSVPAGAAAAKSSTALMAARSMTAAGGRGAGRKSPKRGSAQRNSPRRATSGPAAATAAAAAAAAAGGRGKGGHGGGGGGGGKHEKGRLSGKYGRTSSSGGRGQLLHGSSDPTARRGSAAGKVGVGMWGGGGSGAAAAVTRRVWVRDRVDAMRWRPGCLMAEGESVFAASSGSGGVGGELQGSNFLARLDDGTVQAPRPDGVMDFPTAGGTAAAEAAAAVGGSGAGRAGRNPAAKLASITGALRRHGRNAAGMGSGGSGGGGGGSEDDGGSATTFCKEPATPHAWLCSRQPRTPLGFLPRFGRGGAGGGGSGGGGGGDGAASGGAGRHSRGGSKDSSDPLTNLRRHFTTVSGSEGAVSAIAAAGSSNAGGGGARERGVGGKAGQDESGGGGGGRSGARGTRKVSRASSAVNHDGSPSAALESSGGSASSSSGGDSQRPVSGRAGKKMSIFAGFGKGGSKASRQRHTSGEQNLGAAAAAAAAVEGEAAGSSGGAAGEQSVGAVPLQLEDEGLLQEQGWVYPPRVQLLLAVSIDPEEDTRAGWVELEEDDTIFKCVSVLQARAPTPTGPSPPSAASAGAARGHSLMEGLMGLKRSLGRGRGAEHVLFFRAHVAGGPTSVANGKKADTGVRVPSEEDIRGLSPSLADALLLARSVHGLCARHQSGLAVPLGHEEEDEEAAAAAAAAAVDKQLWVNDNISDSVREALSDILAVAAGFLPPWVDALLSGFPFLLPLDLRLRYFRSLAFGVTRSVAYLQQESAGGDGSRGAGGAPGGGGGRAGAGRRANAAAGGGRAGGARAGGGAAGGLGALRRDIVQVSRSQLLQHAEQVMSMYTPSKAVLEFRFAGEKGLGAGVTASFYSAVAAELQRRSVNTKLPMWVDSDSTGDPQQFLSPPSGLFPAPLPAIAGDEEVGSGIGSSAASGSSAACAGDTKGKALAQQRRSVIGRFRFLGRLAARCMMDGQVLPLSLSVDFLRLVLAVVDDHARSQGQVKMAATTSVVTATAAGSPGPGKAAAAAAAATGAAVVGEEWAEAAAGRETGGPAHATAACLLSVGDFPRLYNRPGAIIRKLVKACKGDKPSGEVDGMPLAEFLELSSLAMTDPVSGAALVAGGEDTDVTIDNVGEFVESVTTRWLHAGILPQVEAFRAGCAEVFPVHMLRSLSAHELRDQLCGEEALEWPLEHLQEAVVPGAGYTRNSQPFCDFLTGLSEMSPSKKRSFLLFVLGCPHLPPGGLCGLSPPLEVSRKQGAGGAFALEDEIDRELPFARTCTHTLHLPPYSKREVLNEKLAYAIENSRGVIDRD